MGPYSSLSIEELTKRCSLSSEKAVWEEFVRRFHRLIAKVTMRVALRFGDPSKETIDDLIQDTYLKFCADNFRLLREFDHRHPESFLGYVQVVATNAAHDHFKASLSKKRGTNQSESLSEGFIPPARDDSPGGPKAIERSVLIEEIQRHLDLCVAGTDSERSSRIFWLYYRAGLSAAAIAALPGTGLSTKGVESLILRVTRDLRKRMTGAVGRDLTASSEGVLPAESF
jgi:RNA polymerase sigma-70 factor (ECF subfamily)